MIPTSPYVALLPERNVRSGFATAEQIERICRQLPSPEADAVWFMFITGWRSYSEGLPLTWPQVDWSSGFVRLRPGTTKNDEGRAFPLIPELRAVLEHRQQATRRCEHAKGRIIGAVFHRNGRPMKALRRSWASACRKAGVPGLLLHDLRRSAVRNLERAGISRSVAMKLTGHKTESVYRRYAIVAERDLVEAGARLSAVVFAPSAIAGTAAVPTPASQPLRGQGTLLALAPARSGRTGAQAAHSTRSGRPEGDRP